ncbi:GNAT family N-acetyltransferase [Kineosporia babensis]|uniref:GNAT family N-acetyltransferase n=1 Tax=Kineosporia babensis TaxID=499548 RepID=A0A9X1NG34_9ACTN|nr:GNAT family protein [Kineosporia babensis]MCD5312666.1 GNAT family N-acetyltransferase [Kineosporia babensis]
MDTGVVIRIVREEDAEPLAAVLRANREFLRPWEPKHDEAYFTADGQRRIIDDALLLYSGGVHLPCAIIRHGELVGRININNIVRGNLQTGDVGYWVAQSAGGQGVATIAVEAVVTLAFTALNLHRVGANTLIHNARSQRVLAKNGFERIGLAPKFLRIEGIWQDHVMFQRVNPDWV